MTTGPDIPDHEQPSAAELDRVRALLAGLGSEGAPRDVIARLERVLDAQLPAAGAVAPRRHRPWARRLVAIGAPAAVIVALVFAFSGSNGPHGVNSTGAGAAGGGLQSAADAITAADAASVESAVPAPAAPADSNGSYLKTASLPDAAANLATAARLARDEVARAIREHRK